MQKDRQQLANSAISVWQEGDDTIIHHNAGMTLALNHGEAVDLLKWLNHMNTVWHNEEELARIEAEQQRQVWIERGE